MNKEELLLELIGTLRDWNDGDEPVASVGQVDDETLGVEFEGGEEFFITIEDA